MENDTKIRGVQPLSSLKPVNSVSALKLHNINLILVGFGNELRIYSQDFETIHDQLVYHDSHNIYGIKYGEADNLVAIYGLNRVVWCRIQIQKSEQGITKLKGQKIHSIKVGELEEYDLFLESTNYIKGKWLIGSSTGKIRLCQFEQKSQNNFIPRIQNLILPQSPTLYCMKVHISSAFEEAMIVSGSAFSTVNVSVLSLKEANIAQEQILKAHNGVVYDLKILGDGTGILSSSDDRKIIVWMKEENPTQLSGNTKKLQFYPKYILVGHEAIIWSIDSLWEKRLIASISEDGDLFVWNLNKVGAKSYLKVNGSNVQCINGPDSKVSKAHQGRGGRVIHSMSHLLDNNKNYWSFITTGEGGDLKVWKFFIGYKQVNIENDKVELTYENDHFVFSESKISPYVNNQLEIDNSSCTWYQGAHLIDQYNLIGVTRQGNLSFGTKCFQDLSKEWKSIVIQDLKDMVYSMSCLNTGHLVLGSSRGKIIHGLVNSITKEMEVRQELFIPDWKENITFVQYFALIDNEFYLALSSCSKGFVGASVSQKIAHCSKDEFTNTWITSIVPIKGTPKYGELKCLDIIKYDNNTQGKIVCGTVSGNIFILNFKVVRKENSQDGLEIESVSKRLTIVLEIWLSKVLSNSHKGNVSSLSWMNNLNTSMVFLSTGQDGKINQYSVKEEARLEWSHRWNSECEYIVKCFKLKNNSNWLIIGAVKHELFFYLTKDNVTCTPILLLKHRFGGIKRSFQINIRNYNDKDILEVIWCQKPSIRVDQLNITDILENQGFSNSFLTPLLMKRSLNVNPPSRLIHSSAWMSNSIVVLGGEDHIVRFYDISNLSKMSLVHSIRLLDPIRRLKVLNIRENVHILMITGGRQMFHIFEIRQGESQSNIVIRAAFSNNNDKKQNNCRLISLDYILYPISIGKSYKLFVIVGSSKGEILVFSFQLLDLGEKLDLNLKKVFTLNLTFVPFSIKAENDSGEILVLVGLSNGTIKVLKSSNLGISTNEFSLDLVSKFEIKAHNSGVNSVILLDGRNNDFRLIASSGHDQKISVSRIMETDEKEGSIMVDTVLSISNAHFSSIRDLCYDPIRRILYSISWDQMLKSSKFDELMLNIVDTKKFPISIWDPSKFRGMSTIFVYFT
ncbi:WD repeat [Cryptosporidium sp. chipmunk genotype I]|uniref:WD repeat n=1 Tax=Cryptosporidium sp. chipmunk genotype I TaxID=1280935 RepID=UPI003519FB9E|nr:WD repeat [Cryptosporidium sp. chipmunk genotype I]